MGGLVGVLLVLALVYGLVNTAIVALTATVPFLIAGGTLFALIWLTKTIGFVRALKSVFGGAVALFAVICFLAYIGATKGKERRAEREVESGEATESLAPFLARMQANEADDTPSLGNLFGEHDYAEGYLKSPSELLGRTKNKAQLSPATVALGRTKSPDIFPEEVGPPTYFTRGPTFFVNAKADTYMGPVDCFAALDHYNDTQLFVTSVCQSKDGKNVDTQTGLLQLRAKMNPAAQAAFGNPSVTGQFPDTLRGLWKAGEKSCDGDDDTESLFIGSTTLAGEVGYEDPVMWGIEVTAASNTVAFSGLMAGIMKTKICKGSGELISGHYHVSIDCGESYGSREKIDFVLCDRI